MNRAWIEEVGAFIGAKQGTISHQGERVGFEIVNEGRPETKYDTLYIEGHILSLAHDEPAHGDEGVGKEGRAINGADIAQFSELLRDFRLFLAHDYFGRAEGEARSTLFLDGKAVNIAALIDSGEAELNKPTGLDLAKTNMRMRAGAKDGELDLLIKRPCQSVGVSALGSEPKSMGVVWKIGDGRMEVSGKTGQCFVRGTRIRTDKGDVAIEELRRGDLVETKDNGFRPIRWVGSSIVPASGELAPIVIRPGALGNARELRVSPQHRMLISGPEAELIFDESEVLVAAKHLANDYSILRSPGGRVEYFHILFDRHEIIFAEGAASESFFIGKQALDTLTNAQAREIRKIFPDLEHILDIDAIRAARPIARGYEVEAIMR